MKRLVAILLLVLVLPALAGTLVINSYRFGGGGGVYDPGADSRVVAWWVGDAITGSDGDAVGTWPDSDDSANDATQATAGAKPSLQTAELNGHSVVRFDGGDKLTPASGVVDATQTIFFVAKNTGTTTHNVIIATGSGADGLGVMSQVQSSGKWGVYDTTPRYADSGISSTFVVASLVRDGTNNKFYLDGVADGVVTQSAGNVFSEHHIGNDQYGDGLIGDLAELIIININLDATDRAAVEAYLAAKYGL